VVKAEYAGVFDITATFASFSELQSAVQEYANATGMQLVVRDSHSRDVIDPITEEKQKLPASGTWRCQLSGRTVDERNEGSRRVQVGTTDCMWQLNYAYRKADKLYHINKTVLEHNHAQQAVKVPGGLLDITSRREVTPSMMVRVDDLLRLNVEKALIVSTLLSEFRLHTIDNVVIKNLLFDRRKALGLSDNGEQVQSLIVWMKQQRDEQGAAFDFHVDVELRTDGIFYMSGDSIASISILTSASTSHLALSLSMLSSRDRLDKVPR
jgi:hypothetical protein